MFTAALAALTRFWGGDQKLLFPLQDDLAAHELFWALVDRLDADKFLIYNGAAADLEDIAPEDYAAARERERQRVAQYDEEVIRRHLDEWRELWIVEGGLPDGLEELLVRRVAPLHDRARHRLDPFGGIARAAVPVHRRRRAGRPPAARLPTRQHRWVRSNDCCSPPRSAACRQACVSGSRCGCSPAT